MKKRGTAVGRSDGTAGETGTGELCRVPGFRGAAVAAGIRKKDRLDLGLIVSDRPAVAAGVFTTNLIKAAPVTLGMEQLRQGQAQAILVNSGIANACTGEAGMRNARLCGAMAADALEIDPGLVQVSSTGVIGEQLDPDRFRLAIPRLVRDLSVDGLAAVARAMMTTDTVPKMASRTLTLDGRQVTVAGLAKGAGMIMPDMATMLCFLLTDAAVERTVLRTALREAVAVSFNAITVDGDTSTNDTVLLLANGLANNRTLDRNHAGFDHFQKTLSSLCGELAQRIVADGEGAGKLVTIRVQGAADSRAAAQVARTVANSCLVKTAFFGQDPNWGRIAAAAGRAGVEFDPSRLAIAFDQVAVVRDGLGLGAAAEAEAARVLAQSRFTVTIDLGGGAGGAAIHTCDLSLDYVRINAEYRT